MESTEARPRRPPTTVWNRTEPTPPRVYRTDPKGFRRLVQELTGKPKETTSTPSPDFPRPPPAPLLVSDVHRDGWYSFAMMNPLMPPNSNPLNS
ncbi:hypothetical protein HPP92_026430 [Vanilla planifolia]|uniref:VQ domain-containing protein n=1 Tax=Vanilla planifolia TaxID=51239 RepID=A0A835PDM3_VANPL|nr:hypothetical protein HPP92_026430 [Vanilla planifolia]KAG0473851.1 hypothetical protein HPP92_015708 [Vanilla planifolia]